MPDHAHTPFKQRTPLPEARERLRGNVEPHGRSEDVPLGDADGRTVTDRIRARRNVPHYPRAAMDGYAVHAEDTFGAGDRTPLTLQVTEGAVEPREAKQVHTGSELPDGADAVVMIEQVERVGDRLEVFEPVGEGENVGPVGEDVERGQQLYGPGYRLRPSDLGLLKSAGVETVTVAERPTVAVIPTGEELVQGGPGPGEMIETNGLTVSRLAGRWGADPTYHDVVTDDESKLSAAVRDTLDADIVVTTGGSSVGARDLLPAVVSELGEILVHGVGIKPGHPVALGIVPSDVDGDASDEGGAVTGENSSDGDGIGDGTPVLMLPGYPVSCLVNAVQFLRPTIRWLEGSSPDSPPAVTARLDEKIYSEPGIHSFARVSLDERDGELVATAVRASGAGVLSTVALSDGWVVVPGEREGIAAGETVTVERWEWSP